MRACVLPLLNGLLKKVLTSCFYFVYYAVLLEVKSMNTHDLKRNREAMSGGIGTGG